MSLKISANQTSSNISILKSKVCVLIRHHVFLLSPPISKLDNSRSVTSGGVGPHVYVEFCQYAGHMSSYVDYRVCPAVASAEGPSDICQRFSVSFKPFLTLLLPKGNFSVLLIQIHKFFSKLDRCYVFLFLCVSDRRLVGVPMAPSVSYPTTPT